MSEGGANHQGERQRSRPNILVTGTPGVGKTATASLIAERLGMRHIDVGHLIRQNKIHGGKKDAKFDTYVLDEDDEDRLLDMMEEMIQSTDGVGAESDNVGGVDGDGGEGGGNGGSGGVVVDYHGCDFFPERWFDLVLVLRTKTEVLYDRLTRRGYSETKRSENMECEIMQVVLDEARESYDAAIVHEVPSDTIEDMESNVERVDLWVRQWIQDNS